MSAATNPRGLVYRCPVCGAELIVVGTRMGAFEPYCCNKPMRVMSRRVVFYRCPVCGAEVAVLRKAKGVFDPHCCNRVMVEESRAA